MRTIDNSVDFKRWFVRLLLWVAVLYVAWSWLGGSHASIAMVFQLSRWLIPLVMDDSVQSLRMVDSGVWQAVTFFELRSVPGSFAVAPISHQIQFRAVMPIPLTLALVLSSDFRRIDRVVVAAAAALLVASLMVMGSLAGTLAALAGQAASMKLIVPEVSPAWQRVSSLLTYLMVVVSPIVSPLLIWAVTCHASILTLFFPQSEE
jgi:hypothetical protein